MIADIFSFGYTPSLGLDVPSLLPPVNTEYITLEKSTFLDFIVIGYVDNVSSCILFIYVEKPLDIAKIKAMPIMPIDPANDTSIVRPFLVNKFFKLSPSAVKNDMFFFLFFFARSRADKFLSSVTPNSFFSAFFSLSLKGIESSINLPSFSLTIRDEYASASSGLCVTMIINLFLLISFSNSMICTLVVLSSAPVGSSARMISGSLTSALAIATLCICPPDN